MLAGNEAVTRKVINYFGKQRADERQDAKQHLTDRELQVLKLAARGMTNREIAGELLVSARTVQVHLSNVFGKLGVGSRTEAVL